MVQFTGLRKNYLVLICMALGILFISYQFTGILPANGPSGFVAEVVESCIPKKNVCFIKTHKCASSTLQNIFMRYADKHELLLVLPLQGNYLGHPIHFHLQMAPRLKSGYNYNILTHHSRYNYRQMKALMPEDAVFVTILRDPVTLFESLYSYYSLNTTFNMDIVEFATANKSALEHHNERLVQKIGRNQMSYDLGIMKHEFDNQAAIMRAARLFDHQFDLVMISEMMDQSLILLKNLLCWDMDDVVAFKHNARKQSNKVTLKPEVEERLRDWNRADQLLYDYFYARFQEKVGAFGAERMEREVNELRQRSAEWYNYCIADEKSGSELDGKFKVYNKQVLGFRLRKDINNGTCENMAKAELPFTKELQDKQHQYLSISATLPTRIHYSRRKYPYGRLYRYQP